MDSSLCVRIGWLPGAPIVTDWCYSQSVRAMDFVLDASNKRAVLGKQSGLFSEGGEQLLRFVSLGLVLYAGWSR